MSRNVVIQPRDELIFRYILRFGFVTLNQLCALLPPNGSGPSRDLNKMRGPIRKRLHFLSQAGLIASAPAPSLCGNPIKAYLLTPTGAHLLKDSRDEEALDNPRWLEKKRHFAWVQGTHDLAAGNFIAHLVALSRLHEDFSVDRWFGSRDCRFYIPNGDNSYLFNPDLYFEFTPAGVPTIQLFLEMDTGNVGLPVLRRKAHRVFQYFASRRYIEDLGIRYFPRVLFIAPTASRLNTIVRELRQARANYNGPKKEKVAQFAFWLSTYADIDISAVEKGIITDKPLGPSWVSVDGKTGVSPFDD
jgi:hypothetical protein